MSDLMSDPMSDPAPLSVERDERVTIIRLTRPDRRNALAADLRIELPRAIDAFFADVDAGCLLITGSGDSFCAGGDVKSFAQPAEPEANRARIQATQAWAGKLLRGDKPVVMAVNGAAAGAGFGLAMLGDITIAAESAFFQAAFSLVGVCPDMLLGMTLQRAIGAPRARDLLFTNRRVTAQEAQAMGMVSRVVPDQALMDEALAVAQRLARGPQPATGLSKALIRQAADVDLAAFMELESSYQAVALGSADHREGVAAFIDKRKPQFGRCK